MARRRIGGGAAHALEPGSNLQTQSRPDALPSDCSAMISRYGKYPPSALSPDSSAAASGHVVEWALWRCSSAADNKRIEDCIGPYPRRWSCSNCYRAGDDGPAVAAVHGAPEFTHMAPRAHHTHSRSTGERAQLARCWGEVAAQKAFSEETIATVLERTGGCPFR